MKKIGTFKIPVWAVYALEYWEFDALEEEDIEQIKKFAAQFPKGYIMDVVGDEYFCTHPDVCQKACMVEDVDFYDPTPAEGWVV